MRGAPRMKLNTTLPTNIGNATAARAFEYVFSTFWTITGNSIFMGGATANATFTLDTSTNAQTNYSAVSDLEIFNGILFATDPTKLWSLSAGGGGGTWTDRTGATALGSGGHMLAYFKKFDRLYVIGTGDRVFSYSTAYAQAATGDYSLNLNTNQQYQLLCMKASSNSIWLGAGAFLNQASRGRIYEWDGISAQPTNEYIIDANACMAIVIDNDIPYALDSNGVLLKFTGSSFEEIGRLPENSFASNDTYNVEGFIHPNGLLATKNDTILALINNVNNNADASINENIPAGIWEFSTEFGPTHKYSMSYNPVASSTITDYGQNILRSVGALASADIPSSAAGKNGTLLVGARYYATASVTTSSGIFINDSLNTIQKKGYFVTTWFNSNEVQDKWSRIWATYRRFLASDDSIIFKYRLYEETPVYATITWTSTTTFTTTTNITAYGPTASGFNGTIGGEVEVLQGTGSGTCTHITSIVNNAGTYTVTLDNAVTGVTTGTAKARFQKWIKLFPEITGQVKSWEQLAIGMSNTRIQIKGCLTFTGDDEFTKFSMFSNEDIKISA